VVTGRGLPEYEAMTRADGGLTIALTLLRCVGWLARTDLSTRTEDAGPAIETPDAQCPGVHVFEYAVSLDGALEDAPLVRASADYRRPVRIGPAGIGEVFPIEVAPDVAFSAFAAAADGHGAMLRLYNPSSGPSSGALGARGATVERVRLDETRLDDPGVPRGLGPSEIATFHVAPPR
jgi:alpha-mannosidase